MLQDDYAHALFQLVENGETPHAAVAKLYESLREHGRTALMPKILRAFERRAQKQMDAAKAKLIVAHETDARHAQHEAEHALGAAHQHMHIHTDPSLIGGWRVEVGETLVDVSYKKQLLAIFNRATAH